MKETSLLAYCTQICREKAVFQDPVIQVSESFIIFFFIPPEQIECPLNANETNI